MPRLARLDAPGVLHHVMGRGIERKEIFLSSLDRNDFIARLAKLAQDGAWAVYAWALLIEARRVMSWLSVRELGYSGAEVARYLGVTNSCVTRAASGREVLDVDKYL
jgi:hypothetical protein